MSLDLAQRGRPISKLDCDAFTRVRIILMNGIESEAVRFSHAAASLQPNLHHELGLVRRAEQHQQTMVNWLLPADLSPLETTIACEQVAIEITAGVAMREPDDYLAQVYRFGLREDFDHLYRFSALLDRLCGKDANNILQSYTDVLPGRRSAPAPIRMNPGQDSHDVGGRGAWVARRTSSGTTTTSRPGTSAV